MNSDSGNASSKSLKLLGFLILALATAVQAFLLFQLMGEPMPMDARVVWLGLHALSSVAISVAVVLVSRSMISGSVIGAGVLALMIGLTIPMVGALGFTCAFLLGTYFANSRNEEDIYWQITDNIDLPFTTPIGRRVSKYDSRGFMEQLMYSDNNEELYKKVLAATNIQASLSVGLLKRAVQHPDDKIRLTAYQTLDRKVTGLNREIQRLEDKAGTQQGLDKSNTWLQIASNYWELITLEKEEPVARKQLVGKAAVAAQKAIDVQPDNRNAHFTLGRALMMQGDAEEAGKAFKQALDLGMPKEKVMPYLAESAFNNREFGLVAQYLALIDDAFKVYPPLKHVAGYWK